MRTRHHEKKLTVFAALLFFLVSATAQAELPVVKLIATGGTIAMKIDPKTNAPVPAISGEVSSPQCRKLPRWRGSKSRISQCSLWIYGPPALDRTTEGRGSDFRQPRSCRGDRFARNGHARRDGLFPGPDSKERKTYSPYRSAEKRL